MKNQSSQPSSASKGIVFGAFSKTIVMAIAPLFTSGKAKLLEDAATFKSLAGIAGATFVPPEERPQVLEAFGDLQLRVQRHRSSMNSSQYTSTIDAVETVMSMIKKQPATLPPSGNGHLDASLAAKAGEGQARGGGHRPTS